MQNEAIYLLLTVNTKGEEQSNKSVTSTYTVAFMQACASVFQRVDFSWPDRFKFQT